MKRVIVFFLVFSLLTGNYLSGVVYGAESSAPMQKKIVVYLKPDVIVELNNVKQIFRDSRGTIVYPMIYNGSTYLPVRAISGMMKEPIEWDEASKTIFIGKTLSDPNRTFANGSNTDPKGINIVSAKPAMVNAYLKPDVLVMYDFSPQSFKDVNGNRVYPIIYNGTTYLPIRAVSQLMNEPIEWDGISKTVLIGDGEETSADNNTEGKNEPGPIAKNLISLFEREEILYYEATAKTTSLNGISSMEEKQLIAEAITDNYINAQAITLEIKSLDISDFNEEQIAVRDKIISFAESTEYYILVLENIAYLAAQDSDYSMLAETFLYFAMDSQTKMEEARTLVHALNQ